MELDSVQALSCALVFLVQFALLVATTTAIVVVFTDEANAQVTNGDFSGGGTGWTSTVPSNSSLSYGGSQLTTVSDNNGGANSRTFASQTITVADPGFLSLLLASYTSVDTDLGRWDYPMVLIDGTFFWVNTSGGLQTSAAGAVDNDDTGLANLTVRTNLAAGSHTIGAGVTSVDSAFGAGTAIWDDIVFQELTQSPAAQTMDQDTTLTLSGANALQVATNSGAASLSVTLSVSNGILNLASTAGLTVSGNGTGNVTLSGSDANINAALDGLVYTPNTGYFGNDTLSFQATGGGVSDTDTIAINVQRVRLDVTKTPDITNVTAAGQTITWTMTVSPDDGLNHNNVTVADTFTFNGNPATLTSGPTYQSGDTNNNNRLNSTETWVYTATYTVTQADMDAGGTFENVFSVDTNRTPTFVDSNTATTTVTQTPALTINKNHAFLVGSAPASVGDVVRYTYTVENTGNLTIANVQVSDVHNGTGTFPANPGNATLTDVAPTGDSPDTNGNATIWGTLAPGDTVTFFEDYTVTQADVDTLQ